jgi:hypothetical protein
MIAQYQKTEKARHMTGFHTADKDLSVIAPQGRNLTFLHLVYADENPFFGSQFRLNGNAALLKTKVCH